MIDGVASSSQSTISPETLVDACLEQVGAMAVADDTKRVLIEFAATGGDLQLGRGKLGRGLSGPHRGDAADGRLYPRVPEGLSLANGSQGSNAGGMMTSTESKTKTDFLEYATTLGMTTMEGRGFYYPTDASIGGNGRIYVVNRSVDTITRGVRVCMLDKDSEYYGNFASYGEGDGQFRLAWQHLSGQPRPGLHLRRIPASDHSIHLRRGIPVQMGRSRLRRR